MARTHIIIPVIPVLKPATINDARARFASVLIDLMDDPPKEEQMDRIEMLLWGRTFGKRHDAAKDALDPVNQAKHAEGQWLEDQDQ